MSQKDDNYEEDQRFVSKHYHVNKKEVPNKALDVAILNAAQEHLNNNKTQKPIWLRWQFGSSVAASVLLVAFVFMLVPDSQVQTDLEPSYALSEAVVPKVNQKPEENDTVEVANFSSDAYEKEESSKPTQKRALEQEAMQSDLTASRRLKAVSIDQSNEALTDTIMITGSRIKSSDLQAQINKVYEQLLRANALSVKTKDETELQQSKQEFEKLQIELFALLTQQKALLNEWQFDEKYQQVLNEEQVEQLQGLTLED